MADTLNAYSIQAWLESAPQGCGTIADERRHVGFGEARIGSLIREHPEKKSEIERMQEEMSYYMLATFADSFRAPASEEERRRVEERVAARGDVGPQEWQGRDVSKLDPGEMERLLSDTVLREFKVRLERIGLDYRTPQRP
jgi:hypothetical protein